MSIAAPVAPPSTAPAPGFAGAGMGIGTGSMLASGMHFGAAMTFLLAGSLGLLWIAPDLAAGRFPEPRVAGVTHLFTLGWLTLTILGALHQLLPVALGTPVRWPALAYASFALLAPGVALFAAGVTTVNDAVRHTGVALVIPGCLLAIANVAASLPRAARRDVTWWAVATSITALFATLALGALLLHNVKTGMLGAARLRVLSMHLHIALIGWVLVMIAGIAHRLLPMFLLAHGAGTAWTARAVALFAGGTALLATGLATDRAPLTWTGALLLECGIAALLIQAVVFFRARVRRRIDAGMRFVATGLAFMALAAVLGPIVLVQGASAPRIATAYVLAGLLGGITLYVTGHFYKVVPFLAWVARYRGRMGREQVPAVADLYSSRLANVQWGVMTAGCGVLVAGTLAGHSHCTRVGSVLFAAGVVIFAVQIVRVALPREVTA